MGYVILIFAMCVAFCAAAGLSLLYEWARAKLQ
jgi:hypothetical protein